MLRILFQEEQRVADGSLAEVFELIDQFVSAIRKGVKPEAAFSERNLAGKLEIWALGLRSSLDELEQSCYAATKYGQTITSSTYPIADEQERLAYSRYLYFDKNAFIRVFSLLDKLGTFLNALLDVRTERVKAHYSYFTVLRVVRERRTHVDFISKINAVKEHYKEPMARLRNRRNTEIHYMNSEMQDDLIQRQRMYGEETRLESVAEQSNDLACGLAMVLESLSLTFQYACVLVRSKKV